MRLTYEGHPIEARVRMRFADFGDHHYVDLPRDEDIRDITDRLAEFKTEILG